MICHQILCILINPTTRQVDRKEPATLSSLISSRVAEGSMCCFRESAAGSPAGGGESWDTENNESSGISFVNNDWANKFPSTFLLHAFFHLGFYSAQRRRAALTVLIKGIWLRVARWPTMSCFFYVSPNIIATELT